MRRATRLFRLFGIDVKIHYSWWFIFILLAWSLATSFFPHFFPDYTRQTYWFMGITASLLLFVSVLLHELSHSLVARFKKIRVESITLFFFGGVAGITKEDMKPSSEFQMAIAGPLFSLVLSGIFYLLFKFNGNGVVTAISFYLYQLNLILAIFNLVPGYPLDGGRAFRAILHAYYKDLKKATRIAAFGGKLVAVVLIVLGITSLFAGAGNGLWFILLGGFLYFIANISYQQVVFRDVLSDIRVRELLQRNITALRPDLPFKDFLRQHGAGGESLFLVQDKDFLGVLDLHYLTALPQRLQKKVKLHQIALPLHQMKQLQAKDSAYKAFHLLSQSKLGALPVFEKKQFLGLVTQEAISNRLALELKFSEKQTAKVKQRRRFRF